KGDFSPVSLIEYGQNGLTARNQWRYHIDKSALNPFVKHLKGFTSSSRLRHPSDKLSRLMIGLLIGRGRVILYLRHDQANPPAAVLAVFHVQRGNIAGIEDGNIDDT